jgi:hypothetical protein
VLRLPCCLGSISVEKLSVVNVRVFLLKLPDLITEGILLLLCTLADEAAQLDLGAIINDLLGHVSELFQLF